MKYIFLAVCLFTYGILNGQNLGITCDSTVNSREIDIFALRSVLKSEEGHITSCFKDSSINYIRVKEKKYNRVFYIKQFSNCFLITTVDSVSGVHRHKLQYDSILVFKESIMFQRKYFTKDKRILKTDLLILHVDFRGHCELKSYNLKEDFSLLNHIKIFSSDSMAIFFSEYTVSEEMQAQLSKCNDTYCFRGKSLFWHMRNAFFDFYLYARK